MTERLLHFIWQMQYYNSNQLLTVSGEPLKVLSAGTYNLNQGPDFQQARVRIRQTTWAGNIELHLRTSDWYRHNHQQDPNYNNVILHVVWQHDAEQNGVPVLELENRVPKLLLQRFENLMQVTGFIPCEQLIGQASNLVWGSWKDRLLAERLERKASLVLSFMNENNNSWEETCWWMLARNFGSTVNMTAFEKMARSIPLNLLYRHRHQLIQLEALLMGQAGLLNQSVDGDDYYLLLQKEYHFLRNKYGLTGISHPVYFLRMRPGNFPTVRLAQLAALINHSGQLFSRILSTEDLNSARENFEVIANDYWHYHYRFGEKTAYREKKLGSVMTDSILINTMTPMLFAYGLYHRDEKCRIRAIKWLESISPENNCITQGFNRLGIAHDSAFDSQALMELKNEYCTKKRCLECGVGNALLRLGND